jgi:hypothetical protein
VYDKEAVTAKIIAGLESGLAEMKAVEAAGIDYKTWWNWKQADPPLRGRAEEAKLSRIEIVEDALYREAIKGDVPAQKEYLYNRAPERWKPRQQGIVVNQNNLQLNMQTPALIGEMPMQARLGLRAALTAAGFTKNGAIKEIPHTNGNGGNGANGNGSGHEGDHSAT